MIIYNEIVILKQRTPKRAAICVNAHMLPSFFVIYHAKWIYNKSDKNSHKIHVPVKRFINLIKLFYGMETSYDKYKRYNS